MYLRLSFTLNKLTEVGSERAVAMKSLRHSDFSWFPALLPTCPAFAWPSRSARTRNSCPGLGLQCRSPSRSHEDTDLDTLLDQEALIEFVRDSVAMEGPIAYADGARLLREHNCLDCHDRGESQGIWPSIRSVIRNPESRSAQADGLLPPSLNSVGDKLRTGALHEAIARTSEVMSA